MKHLLAFGLTLVFVNLAQAAILMNCEDSQETKYVVSRENKKSVEAKLSQMQGDRVVKSVSGKYEAGGSLNQYYIILSDEKNSLLVLGTDGASGSELSGFVKAFGESRQIRCALPK